MRHICHLYTLWPHLSCLYIFLHIRQSKMRHICYTLATHVFVHLLLHIAYTFITLWLHIRLYIFHYTLSTHLVVKNAPHLLHLFVHTLLHICLYIYYTATTHLLVKKCATFAILWPHIRLSTFCLHFVCKSTPLAVKNAPHLFHPNKTKEPQHLGFPCGPPPWY